MLMANILFRPFNFGLSTSFSLLIYSFLNIVFISFSMAWLYSSIPKYLYPFSSIFFITWPSGNIIPLHSTTFPLFNISTAHFFTPNFILMCVLKKSNVFGNLFGHEIYLANLFSANLFSHKISHIVLNHP